MENPEQKRMITEGTPILGNLQIGIDPSSTSLESRCLDAFGLAFGGLHCLKCFHHEVRKEFDPPCKP